MINRLSPLSDLERIGSLDFLRGLAVLGILIINIESFAYPEPWSPYKYGYQGDFDHQVRFWVYFLAQGKFFSMFTMLFGVSFCLFLERLSHKQSSSAALDRYLRRLLVLFLIGVGHAYLIWDGDILYHYAVCGLLILPFKSLGMKGLMMVLGVLMFVVTLRSVQTTLSTSRQKIAFELAHSKPSDLRTDADEKAIASWKRKTSRKKAVTKQIDVPRRTILESVTVNASHQKVHRGAIVYQGILFRTMIMMVLGLIFYRIGVFRNYQKMKGYWPFTLIILMLALWINYERYYQWTFQYDQPVTVVSTSILQAFHKESLGLAYMLLFNGLFQLVFRHMKWKLISNMGRMALTNYLMQSIFCAFIFYGYGFGWHNQFSRSELWHIIPLIWLIQIVFSQWWINRYNQGPVEMFWKKLVYYKS